MPGRPGATSSCRRAQLPRERHHLLHHPAHLLARALLLTMQGVQHLEDAGQHRNAPLHDAQLLLRLLDVDRDVVGAPRVLLVRGGGELDLLAQHPGVRGRRERCPVTTVFATLAAPTPRWANILFRFTTPMPTAPTRCRPMAAALTGVQRAQPLLAIRAVRRLPPSSSAAPLSPTTPIRDPPNQAAKPTSFSARMTVLRSDTCAPSG